MSVEVLASVTIALIAFFGLIGGSIAWFYKRGGQEREFTIALRSNTSATEELTKRFDTFMERSILKQEATDERVNNHETRITVNERDIRDIRKAVQ